MDRHRDDRMGRARPRGRTQLADQQRRPVRPRHRHVDRDLPDRRTGRPAGSHGAVDRVGRERTSWGGPNGYTSFNSGAQYIPAPDTWRAASKTGAPSARAHHSAVWTGSEMIVWGGCSGGGILCSTATNTGGRYNPATNS